MNQNVIPRRARVDQMSAAEKAILEAIWAVESVGADTRLTHAVVLLGKAKDSVSDFIDDEMAKNAAPSKG